MSYALSMHRGRWWPQPAPIPACVQRYALVDVGQLQPRPAALVRWLTDVAHTRLFEGCFAETAIDLSPVLIALDQDEARASSQVQTLDRYCHALPIMSILASALTLQALTQHLQTLLKVEADGQRYLLRLADTQMLSAALSSLTPAQRAAFLTGIAHWWIVDYEEQCSDMVPPKIPDDIAPLPLVLSAEQTVQLIDAAELPIAANQLRTYDPAFGELTHAQQMRFMHECSDLLSQEEAASEMNLLLLALRLWRERQQNQGEMHVQNHE